MKKVIRGFLFSVLLILVVQAAYGVVSWKDTTGDYLSSVQQLYHTEEGLIDVLFVGSSHCYCSVYPEYLWREGGIAAFDLAVSGQDKWASYYSVKEALKTQKPKAVFIECYGLLYDGYQQEGNKHRNLLSYKLSRNSISLVRKVQEEGGQMDYILRWPIVHTRYRELGRYDFEQYAPSVYGRGAGYNWAVATGPYLPLAVSCDTVEKLSEENKRWIDELIALSREEDFALIFFVAPKIVDEQRQTVFNSAAQYAREQGVDFIDFGKLSEELKLDSERDFADGNHCNADGAFKVTKAVGNYLSKQFELADHRGDEAYTLWEQNDHYFRRLETEREYNITIENMEDYLTKALGDEDVVMIVNVEGSRETYSQELRDCLEVLGIDAEQYPGGGKWIWRGGECILSMDDKDPQALYLDLSDTDTLRVENRSAKYGESAAANVMLNRTAYGRDKDGMTVLLYDTFRGAVTGLRELE